MINRYPDEEWKSIQFDDKISEKEKYKVSNYGRILNCKGESEILVKATYINGYQNLPVRLKKTGKPTSRYVHKLVAQHFLEQNDGVYVIHLNYNKKDNRVQNLKWATKQEKEQHQFSNPEFKERASQKTGRVTNAKLTETRVKLIKRKLNDPNRRTRLKMIAKQFGISEMQLRRIKTGENWGYVTEY